MAKVSAMTSATAARGDYVYFVDDPTGTPLSRRTTAGQIADLANVAISQITATGTPSGTTYLRGDGTWATVSGGGGTLSSETNALAVVTSSNPASPYAASSLTGSTWIYVTGLDHNLQLDKFTFSGTAPTGMVAVTYVITASGGARTISFGSGFSFDGIGQAPSLVIASGETAIIQAYTRDGGTTCYYTGGPTAAQLMALLGSTTVFKAVATIYNPANGPEVLLAENTTIGTVVSALYWTDTGSATMKLQIADKTGASDYTATGAADITSLTGLSVSTTKTRTAATAANTMAKSGTSDRILQAVLSSVSGSPTKLVIEIEYTP